MDFKKGLLLACLVSGQAIADNPKWNEFVSSRPQPIQEFLKMDSFDISSVDPYYNGNQFLIDGWTQSTSTAGTSVVTQTTTRTVTTSRELTPLKEILGTNYTFVKQIGPNRFDINPSLTHG